MKLVEAYTEFLDSMIGVLSDSTVAWYRQRLQSLVSDLGDRDIEDISVGELRRWRRRLVEADERWSDNPHVPTQAGRLSPWTVAGYVRACRRLFNWLVEERVIERSPAARLRMPELPDPDPKAISREDMQAILEAAKENPRDYALVRFFGATGARLSGVAGLRVSDLDLDNGKAVVWEKGKGGSGQARFVHFGETTAEALAAYLAVRESESDRVWIGKRGPLTKWGVYHVLRRLAEKAGVEENWNPHAFRHAWAIYALEAGADLGTVRQVLGHSDITVTHRHYGRWADDGLGERARKFAPID